MPGAFTVRHFFDLVVALEEHPDWREELRRLLLTEDVLTLPQAVRELTEAHRRAEERLSRLEAAVAELTEAHRRAEERLAKAEERLAGVEERLSRLEAVVAELAEAHRRAEERLAKAEERLAGVEERLSRLEAVVAELAEAQRRTEARVEELAEAQRRTEARVEELAEAQRRTEEQVAKIDSRLNRWEAFLSLTVEDEAADVLRVVMERKGYRVCGPPVYWRPDGDIDVILPVEDPEGNRLHAVLEAKARPTWRAVEDWANRMRSEGFRSRLARNGWEGPYLIYLYGMRPDVSAEDAARRFGIGLLNPRGEIVPPRGPE